MNTLFVLPLKRQSDTLEASDHDGTPAMRLAVEQAFYDIHGTPAAERLLRFVTWIEKWTANMLEAFIAGKRGFRRKAQGIVSPIKP